MSARSLPVTDSQEGDLQQKLAAVHLWHSRTSDEFHNIACALTFDPETVIPAPLPDLCNLVMKHRGAALDFLFKLVADKNSVSSRKLVLQLEQAEDDAAAGPVDEDKKKKRSRELESISQLDHECDAALKRSLDMVSKQQQESE